LHHLLLAPLENAGYLEGKRTLIIAPHAELHYLPFAALLEPGPGGETFLIESYDVAYAPSASVWTRLARRRPVEGRGLLAMAPLPDALPNSVREVRAISRRRSRGGGRGRPGRDRNPFHGAGAGSKDPAPGDRGCAEQPEPALLVRSTPARPDRGRPPGGP
ncbi:MAG: CHAT domain-containing protein, partial [Gemmatimonadetes bacterium]|nr:CHAT domain-containing protein [Gemmatimonadota bacterium]NIQ58887.1 CHAT domain-containing protein [Gemmatimonadota bacterium]NIU79064.1 CHAT domain-containing protein [Gammaproteobacteria bacterium]NIX47791.1 CHAT domain-containing protein [Gemmatimonadota bacterium]NIY12146.1 CHAT domain-containing protein [Gemmatimonadota bacterium]